MPLMTKTVVDFVCARGAEPFLVPAMGSHGGATAEGQVDILRSLGITEEAMGCKIYSDMDPILLGEANGLPLYQDRYAAQADGIILLNRVKMHTGFRGHYESGLLKMLAVGLGKEKGAETCHAAGEDELGRRIEQIGLALLNRSKVILGVALLENAYDQTFDLEVVPAEEIAEREPTLLIRAKEHMGKLFLESCDVLIVKNIGKNYSGAGTDPNIVGRCANPKLKSGIRCRRMGFLDLSEESHGNAVGIGRADICSKRLYEKMDFDQTYPNFMACKAVATFKIPIVAESNEDVLKACIFTCINIDQQRPRVVLIDNSLEIDSYLVSEALLPEVGELDKISVEGEAVRLTFDEKGKLLTRIRIGQG